MKLGESADCKPVSTSVFTPLIVALTVPCDGELNAELLNTPSPSFDKNVPLNCAEPDTTPPVKLAERVSPVNIISTLVVSDTAKFVSVDISTLVK